MTERWKKQTEAGYLERGGGGRGTQTEAKY